MPGSSEVAAAAAAEVEAAFKDVQHVLPGAEAVKAACRAAETLGLSARDTAAKFEAWALQQDVTGGVDAALLDRFAYALERQAKLERTAGRAGAAAAAASVSAAASVGAVHTAASLAHLGQDLASYGMNIGAASAIQSIQSQAASDMDRTAPLVAAGTKRERTGDDVFATPRSMRRRTGDDDGAFSPGTWGSPVSFSPGTGTGGSSKFDARPNPGRVEATVNDSLPAAQPGPSDMSVPRIHVQASVMPEPLTQPYRHMYVHPEQVASVIENRIVDLGNAIMDKLEVETDVPVSMQSQSDAIVIGRICSDAGDGKLSFPTLLLEGRDGPRGSGSRVRMDMQHASGIALFPGQVIAASARNPSGDVLHVSAVHCDASQAPTRSTVQRLRQLQPSPADPRPYSIIVAAGPFSNSDNLEYKPLAELVAVVRKQRPDALVLLGPFVDAQHEMIRTGNVPGAYERVYNDVMSQLADQLRGLGPIRLILVPSTRDIHHEFVLPQPPLAATYPDAVDTTDPDALMRDPLRQLGPEQVVRASNPAVMLLNEVTVAAVSEDVIRHLAGAEIEYQSPPDRVARLARHLLQQRSLYPLYPASKEVPLDLRGADMLTMPCLPDILLVPSDLKWFAKVIDGVVCLNPGRLARGTGGGTYARISIHGMPEEKLAGRADTDQVTNDIAQRTRVDIIRI